MGPEPGIEVRRAVATEARAVADVWLRSRRASVPAIPAPVHPDDEVRGWFADVVLPDREVWVATDGTDGAIVAVLVLDGGWLDQLHVAPGWFGRGIGTALVDRAKAERPGGLDLWTFAGNTGARRFYERHGFVAVATTDGDNEEGEPDIRYHWPINRRDDGTGAYEPMALAIETERLALRLRDLHDAPWYVELLAEHPGRYVQTLDEARAHLAEHRRRAFAEGIGFLAIERRTGTADGRREPIGYAGLLVGRYSFDEPEIAYELLRRAHGHGYATEAAQAVLDAAFATGRRRVWATVGGWNGPSLRVLDRLGFRRDRVEILDDGDERVHLVRDA